MKQYIMGIVTGIIITAGVTAFAAQMEVKENPFKILVNGTEKNIAGYNINDNTYFKLRDVADATGNLEVGFENDTILLNTTKEETPVTPTPTKTPSEGKYTPPKELMEPDKHGEPPVRQENGTYYILGDYIFTKAYENGFDPYYIKETEEIVFYKEKKEVYRKKIVVLEDASGAVPYDEYIDEILPILEGK